MKENPPRTFLGESNRLSDDKLVKRMTEEFWEMVMTEIRRRASRMHIVVLPLSPDGKGRYIDLTPRDDERSD